MGDEALSDLHRPVALFQAIRSGNLIEVKRLIEDFGIAVSSRGSLEEPDNTEVSALHFACWLKEEEIASALIDLGADIESYDEMGSTPLLYACQLGLLSIVKKLVEKKCDVLSRNKNRVTALHHGCEAGNVEICCLLLDNEALLDALDIIASTPLHWACKLSKTDVVKLLIERGADIEAKDTFKRTPFLASCEAGSVEIMKFLSEKGCDMTAMTETGAGALHRACLGYRTEAIDWLISAGFHYCDIGNLGCTTLHCACQGGHLELVIMLVNEHGLDLEQRAENGMTPFLSAVVSGNSQLVKWLGRKGCKVWVRNQEGDGALHLALTHSNEEVFFYLFRHFCHEDVGVGSMANLRNDGSGVQISSFYNVFEYYQGPSLEKNNFRLESVNDNGETLFLVACKQGLLRSVKFLCKIGANFLAKDKHGKSGLHLCCENGHTPTAEYLMNELGLDPEETDDMNETSLMKACGSGVVTTAETLMKTRKWDLCRKNKNGENALHLTCRNIRGAKVARFLINFGIDVKDKEFKGWTPMMIACCSGLLSVVRILAELDSRSVNQKNWHKQSLLHLACRFGNHGVSQFLINSRVVLDERDLFDCTPLAYACQSGLFVVTKRLVEMGCSLNHGHPLDPEQSLRGNLIHFSCCKGGYANIVRFLVQSGVDYNQTIVFQSIQTPLMVASQLGFLSVVKFLVSLNSSLASATSRLDNGSALYYACRNGHTSVADFLLGSISDVLLNSCHSGTGKTALVYAYENGMLSTVRQLESRGCSLDTDALLVAACKGGLISSVKRIVTQNRSVVRDVWKYFIVACVSKKAEVAVFLMTEFGDEILVENGSNALFVACENGCLCAVNRLVTWGCSLNDRTSDGANLLLLACSKRHANIVHLLLDAGATTDETELLKTASELNMLSVVSRLCDSGRFLADEAFSKRLLHLAGGKDVAQFFISSARFMLNELDSDGNSLLMAACRRNNLEVASYLIEKGCSVNQKNEYGESPFSEFLEYCWACDVLTDEIQFLLMQFISAGADMFTFSRVSKANVLHLAAAKIVGNAEEMCRFFLVKGADPSSCNEDGLLPYECAEGNVRKILREAWQRRQYSRLEELGTKKPSKIKVCLIGAANAGKTTLMNSLRQWKQIEGELTLSSEIHVNELSYPRLQTAGIDIIKAVIDEAGEVVFCDFAGQPNFHKTHSLFFSESTTVYLLVVNLEELDQELYSSSLYWLSLIKCSIGSSASNCVVIVGSRGDKVDGCGLMKRLQTSLQSKFENLFDFSEIFIMDCRCSASPVMRSLRKLIHRLKTKIIEEAPAIFSIVDKVQSSLLLPLRDVSKTPSPLETLRIYLPKFVRVNKDGDAYFLEIKPTFYSSETVKDALNEFPSLEKQLKTVHCRHFVSNVFFSLLVQSNVHSGLRKEVIHQFVKFLHGIGEIIKFGENIILDPTWLCHNVIGPLMSPETFPVWLEGVDDGTVSAERVEKAIRQFNKNQSFFSVKELMELLCSLEICYSVSNQENVYRFPALIVERRRNEFWRKNEDMIVYVGRRLQCKDETDIIVPGTIPFLQTRSVVRLDPSPLIWKDGMLLEKRIDKITIEGLIELQETARAIDVVARGPVDSEAECFEYVTEMLYMVHEVLDDRSPGTVTKQELCLSTSALKKLIERPPAHHQLWIESAKSNDSFVTAKVKTVKYTDTLRELLVVPTNHYCMIPRQVKAGLQKSLNLSKKSHVLGKELGLKTSEVIACKDFDSILRLWDKRLGALLSELVCCLRKCGLLAALHVLHSDAPSVQLSDDEALAAERAFISAVAGGSEDRKDGVQEDHVIGNQVVEERHIDLLKEEVIENAEVLCEFARKLHGWSFIRAEQFLNNFDESTSTKFFRVVKKWTDDKGINATVGELLKAFEKIGRKGAALRVLSQFM